MSAHVHIYPATIGGVATCSTGDSVLVLGDDGRWVEQLPQPPVTSDGESESRADRERARLATAERNRRALAEWALREYLNAITAAQVRAAELIGSPTFRDTGATYLHRTIARHLTREYQTPTPEPEPKVERLRARVAERLESGDVPASWLELLGET